LRTKYEQRRLDFAVERLKFIDETGINLAMTRLYGRAAPGVRVVDRLPHNYGENISLLAALGLASLSAPMTVEGAVDAAVFRIYVEQGWDRPL
jgi:DDE superfamily endonuclease